MGYYCDLLTPQRIEDEQEVDVFEEIVDDTEYQYQAKRGALWAVYRFRFIGSCDVDSWIQVMRDRNALIQREYDMKLRAYAKLVSDVSTDGADMTQASNESTMVNEHEDTPGSADDNLKYISERNTMTVNGKNYQGLQSVTVRDWMDGVARDPIRDYADEFGNLFVYC